jgi:hypothetical protein
LPCISQGTLNELSLESQSAGGTGGGENVLGVANGAVVCVMPRASSGRDIGLGSAVCTGVGLLAEVFTWGANDGAAPS